MNIDACYQLGQVIKPHGTKGEVQVFLDVDDPGYYKKLESVFLEINQKLVPFFITSIQISNNIGIVKFEDINSIEDTDSIISAPIYLPDEFLPALEEGQFYYHEIIGYKIQDSVLGFVGEIVDIITLPKNEIFSFTYKGVEVLAPLNDAVIQKIDHQNKVVEVTLPEGLIDVYLNP